MLRTLDLRGRPFDPRDLPRAHFDVAAAVETNLRLPALLLRALEQHGGGRIITTESFIAERFSALEAVMKTPVSLVASIRSFALASCSNPVISRRCLSTAGA